MGTALLVLFIAAIVVFVTALRRPKQAASGRQDPLAFTAAAPQFVRGSSDPGQSSATAASTT
jgi:hypothetical protein